MKCPKCQAENPNENLLCHDCGSKFPLTCPQCSTEVHPDDRFCRKCGRALEMPFEIQGATLRSDGERRQATVMFSDLSGYTRMTERLDPEEVNAIMDRVFGNIAQIITRFEGQTESFIGDAVMALFGVPKTHEDDPVRAIMAAREIHKVVSSLTPHFEDKVGGSLRMHTGINTGLVVTGGANPRKGLLGCTGDAINVASRLQGLATPGEILVGDSTYQRAKGYFIFEELGPIRVKGKQDPIAAYRVLAPSNRGNRFEISAENGLTPLVGRDKELELLMDGFKRATGGTGQAFSIVGEAGVGKSRLLHEFQKSVYGEGVTVWEGRALSYSKYTGYKPIIEILKSAFGVVESDGDDEIGRKIRRGLKTLKVDEASKLPYILALLTLRTNGLHEMTMSTMARKDLFLEAVRDVVLKGSEIKPIVIIIEDLQWIDHSSEEIINSLFDAISAAKVLILLTYRPDYVNQWGSRSDHKQVRLNRLSNRESLAMVTPVLGAEHIDRKLADLIIEKAGGIPFFIEEFVKSLEELKIIGKTKNRYHLIKDIRVVTIPSTIHDVIMARIDTLPRGAKKVLQIGSVIEWEFSHQLIQLLADLPEKELASHLSALAGSGFLYERGSYPNSTYYFKHALIMDVAVQSLLKPIRRQYHRKIAEVMEKNFPEIAGPHPEILGHHFSEAGLLEKAIPYCRRAGEIAIRRSANLEAIEHLSQALKMLEALPEGLAHTQKELELQITLGPAWMAVSGYSAPEVEKAYTRARELCQRLGETPELFAILRGLWGFYIVRGDLQTAEELGKQCHFIAERAQKPADLLWTHFMLGMTFFHFGYFTSARSHFERSLALYDLDKRRSPRALQDPAIACLSYNAVALWVLGYPDQALRQSRESLALAQRLSHPFSTAYALNMAAFLSQFNQNGTDIRKRAKAAKAICSKQKITYWLSYSLIFIGWALTKKGHHKEGIKKTLQGLESYRAMGAELVWPYFLGLLAEVYAMAKRHQEGLAVVTEALAFVEKSKERWWEAELYRLRGKSILEVPPHNDAETEACFHQAIVIARHQCAKSLELRASMSLARIWSQQGKGGQARELLSEIYGWFKEGFDTPDLLEASGLLNELG